MNNVEQAKAALRKKADLFRVVFKSPNGEEVLRMLEKELNPDELFVDGDAHKTSYNLGKRDALIYINQMLRFDDE